MTRAKKKAATPKVVAPKKKAPAKEKVKKENDIDRMRCRSHCMVRVFHVHAERGAAAVHGRVARVAELARQCDCRGAYDRDLEEHYTHRGDGSDAFSFHRTSIVKVGPIVWTDDSREQAVVIEYGPDGGRARAVRRARAGENLVNVGDRVELFL